MPADKNYSQLCNSLIKYEPFAFTIKCMNSNYNATDQREPLPQVSVRQPVVGRGALAAAPARVSSQALFCGANEVEIEHHGAVYRLRLTALGKLILTK